MAVRAALSPDGGASLAARLEAIAMDMYDDEDDEDDYDEDDDAEAAQCAALIAAACSTLEARALKASGGGGAAEDRRWDESSSDASRGSRLLLRELRDSRLKLLQSLRRNMQAVASEPRGARASLMARQRLPTTFPYLTGGVDSLAGRASGV